MHGTAHASHEKLTTYPNIFLRIRLLSGQHDIDWKCLDACKVHLQSKAFVKRITAYGKYSPVVKLQQTSDKLKWEKIELGTNQK